MGIMVECDFCGTYGGKSHYVYKEVDVERNGKATVFQNFIICDKCYEKHKAILEESKSVEESLNELKQELDKKINHPLTKTKGDCVETPFSLGLIRKTLQFLDLLPFKKKLII